MADQGWIKIYRKIFDSPSIKNNPNYLSVWLYLLTNATHKEIGAFFKGEKIILKPGQLITGRKSIAKITGVTESTVRRALARFKTDHQIDQQISNKNSLISILNWDDYQKGDHLDDQLETNKRPTRDQQKTTNKNVKNDKNVKNNNITALTSEEVKAHSAKFFIPLQSKVEDPRFYPVTEKDIKQYKMLYPAVDVEQEIRKMIGWCDSKIKNRKTPRGVKSFITNWLSRTQDRSRSGNNQSNQNNDFGGVNFDN